MRYLLRRTVLYLIILLAIIVFFILALYLIQTTYNREYSYADALVDGFGHVRDYFLSFAQGRWGVISPYVDPETVTRVITESYPRSMGLLLLSLALGSVLGIALGTIAAVSRRAGVSLAALNLSILGISAPAFFLAVILQAAVIRFTLATGVRLVTVGGFGWDEHLILPTIVLAARPLAQMTRVTFVTLNRVLAQDYIRTALAKGLSTNQMLRRHALKNAAIPILAATGVSLRFSLSTLPVVEVLFSWPGLGYRFFWDLLLVNPLPSAPQPPTIVSYRFYWDLVHLNRGVDPANLVMIVLLMGLTFIVVNLMLDGLYHLLDPRLRESTTTY